MVKFEQLPNGKWKPVKDYKPTYKDGKRKYHWDDPAYQRKVQKALESIQKECQFCGTYTLAEPCIHHLPDGYKNDMRRKAYYKKLKAERNSVIEETTTAKTLD